MARLTADERINLQNNLKELNRKLHYTVSHVAERSGVSESSLENYLSNRKGASADILKKLADFYGTTPDALISPNIVASEIALQKAVRQSSTGSNKRTTYFDSITEIIEALCPYGKQFTALINLIQQFGYNVIYMPTFTADEINAFSRPQEGALMDKEKAYNKQMELRMSTPMDKSKVNADTLEKLQAFMESKKDLLASLQSSYVDQRLSLELFIEKYNNGDFDNIDVADLPLDIRLQSYKSEKALKDATCIEDMDYFNEDYPISKFMELLDCELEDFITGFLDS